MSQGIAEAKQSAERAREASKWAVSADLPDLTGDQRDVEEAEPIRKRVFLQIGEKIPGPESLEEPSRTVFLTALKKLSEEKRAVWWLNHGKGAIGTKIREVALSIQCKVAAKLSDSLGTEKTTILGSWEVGHEAKDGQE